jgi:hypothetical protein
MLRDADDSRLVRLKKRAGLKTKVDVVRAGLDLLEDKLEREQKVARWKRAVALARDSSHATTLAFQKSSRLKRVDDT